MIRPAEIFEIEDAVNHPALFDTFAPPGSDFKTQMIDMEHFVERPGHVALRDDKGNVMLFPRLRPCEYDSHFAFLPHTRGSDLLRVAESMLNTMFTAFNASAIWGYPPRDNRAVRLIGRRLGYLPTGRHLPDAYGRDSLEYLLRRERWAGLYQAS